VEPLLQNQEGLKKTRVEKDIQKALKNAECVIFAVPHDPYLSLNPAMWSAGRANARRDRLLPASFPTTRYARYFWLGCEVKALGRGHIQRIKEAVAKKEKVTGLGGSWGYLSAWSALYCR